MLSKDLDLAHQDPSSENYCKNNVFLITDMVCMLANKESNYKRDRTILYTGLFCSVLFDPHSTLASHFVHS